jgi:hypothetical protein
MVSEELEEFWTDCLKAAVAADFNGSLLNQKGS